MQYTCQPLGHWHISKLPHRIRAEQTASKPFQLTIAIRQLPVGHKPRKPQHQQQVYCSVSMSNNNTSLPFLCGLTGSIGMGKSTVSAMLMKHGVPVLSADDVVHQLYAVGGAAVEPVGAAFPSAVVNGAVDRTALSKCVVGNAAGMKQLEGIVHPLVEQERVKFVQQHASQGSPLVIFDIPLLYETKAEAGLDAVIVVSASEEHQYGRVMARPGMTEEKLKTILARQVPDAEKRQRADYLLDTGCSLVETEQQVVQLLQQLRGRTGTAAARLLEASYSQPNEVEPQLAAQLGSRV